MTGTMTFEAFVAEINRLAVASGATGGMPQPYCDDESWRDAYDDDMSPAEAWAEEVSNWEQA